VLFITASAYHNIKYYFKDKSYCYTFLLFYLSIYNNMPYYKMENRFVSDLMVFKVRKNKLYIIIRGIIKGDRQ